MKRLTLEEFLKQPAGTMYLERTASSPSLSVKGETAADGEKTSAGERIFFYRHCWMEFQEHRPQLTAPQTSDFTVVHGQPARRFCDFMNRYPETSPDSSYEVLNLQEIDDYLKVLYTARASLQPTVMSDEEASELPTAQWMQEVNKHLTAGYGEPLQTQLWNRYYAATLQYENDYSCGKAIRVTRAGESGKLEPADLRYKVLDAIATFLEEHDAKTAAEGGTEFILHGKDIRKPGE